MEQYFSAMLEDGVYRIILSKPVCKGSDWKRVTAERKAAFFLVTRLTDTQAFHETVPMEQMAERMAELMERHFLQANGFSAAQEHMMLRSKKGKVTAKVRPLSDAPRPSAPPESHDRKKHYLLEEGYAVPALVDMGIFTPEGKLVRAKSDKFRQINRFLEILDDEIQKAAPKRLRVVDFGCGKSYLTFLVYDYLTRVRGMEVEMTGLDLKRDVIAACNAAAERYGYAHLHFAEGDIASYRDDGPIDLVMTLHACDTATDAALAHAVRRGAKMIFSVPCCQHELNAQFASEALPILGRYGILQERFCAIATDAIRANLLEWSGYRAQVMEFIDIGHTPKNLLIRAVRRGHTGEDHRRRALAEVEALMRAFRFRPALYRMLVEEKKGDKS